jgi:PEP-CTERM motif
MRFCSNDAVVLRRWPQVRNLYRFNHSAAFAVVALALLLGVTQTARAVIITYAPPTIVGTNVTYPAVTESSASDPVPLYGAPAISGNNLVFNNLSFSASSINGAATDFTDGQLNFTLQANPGFFLQSITWSEGGDWNITPFPNAASVNQTKVFPQSLQITVLDVNGVPLGSPLSDNTSVTMTYTPFGGTFITGIAPNTGSWNGSALANLLALFPTTNGKITKVAISFDNQLAASSQVGGIASISKKSVLIVPGFTPEPSTLAVFGLLGAFAMRRRKA